MNFLVRFASKHLFYWIMPSHCSENSLVPFVRFFGFGVLSLLLSYVGKPRTREIVQKEKKKLEKWLEVVRGGCKGSFGHCQDTHKEQ